MNHRAEIALHQYLEKVVNGKGSISQDVSSQISKDVYEAVLKQFGSNKPTDFKLRMSNVGRPYCQLWFEKNKPETALPKPTTFIMNMLLGDIVEAVFKGLLKEAGVEYKDSDSVALALEDASIKGTYDIAIDGSVDDIKSASDWSFKHKFESFDTLKDGDAFGYIGQLAGYAKASGLKAGGWWVINKANGDFKYVPANTIDVETEVNKIQNIYSKLKINKFEAIKKNIIDNLSRNTYISIENDVFPKLVGQKFFAYVCDSDFIDIGNLNTIDESVDKLRKISLFSIKG